MKRAILASLALTFILGGSVYAQSSTVGGRLYDKWWSQADVEAPSTDQPLWANQSSNARSGADTWRCKECHGWDYKGVDGAYGSGSHKTGFAGLLNSGLSEAEMIAWLDGSNNSDHDFSAMGADQLPHLARFLSTGLEDLAPVVDMTTKMPISANTARGQELYGNTCMACHTADGTGMVWEDEPEEESIGEIASDNPWEFVHKVRVGQPGSQPPMPAAIDQGWSLTDVADLLSYVQTLTTGQDDDATAIAVQTWARIKQQMRD